MAAIDKLYEEWEQLRIIHCPYANCKGMLLQNKFKHEELCSKCDTLFMEHKGEWVVVEENYFKSN